MIAANYSSFWVGYLILAAVKGLVQSITLLWLKPFFLAWSVRNAVEIDDDLLLFQLGPHQICLMHPPTRRLALFALGKGPVVVASR